MGRYCLVTRLVDKPSICLYFKGIEAENGVYNALNAVVAFTPADALELDENTAKSLCNQLNADRGILLSHGYTEFIITKITSSI